MNEPTIERGVPIPPRQQKGSMQGFIRQLEVGDSFYHDNYSGTLRASVSEVARKTGRVFTSRKDGEGIRVWRVS